METAVHQPDLIGLVVTKSSGKKGNILGIMYKNHVPQKKKKKKKKLVSRASEYLSFSVNYVNSAS